MRRPLFASLLVAALTLTLHGDLQAQTFRIGGQGVYSSRTFADAWGVGGRVGVGIPLLPIEFQGIFDYYWPDCPAGSGTCESWSAGANVLFADGRTGPYFGLGAIYNQSRYPCVADDGVSTEIVEFKDWAFDITAGLIFDVLPRLHPFADFRYEWYFGDAQDQLVISVGFIL